MTLRLEPHFGVDALDSATHGISDISLGSVAGQGNLSERLQGEHVGHAPRLSGEQSLFGRSLHPRTLTPALAESTL